MKKLYQALSREAQEELVRNDVVELLRADFEIGGNPENQEDRDEMTRIIHVNDEFARDLPWLNDELSHIRKVCNESEHDFNDSSNTLLNAFTLQTRGVLAEMRECAELRTLLVSVTPTVDVWAISWMVSMEDDGKLNFDHWEFLNPNVLSGVTQAKVRDRIRYVNGRVGRVVKRLMGG